MDSREVQIGSREIHHREFIAEKLEVDNPSRGYSSPRKVNLKGTQHFA